MSEEFDEDYEIPIQQQGFDRGIDYHDTKEKLINKFKSLENDYKELIKKMGYDRILAFRLYKEKNIIIRKLIYTLIAMNQLRNGCRISESVRAFIRYYKDNKFHDKVVVKISKSDTAKINKHGDRIVPKPRYRNIKLQEWCKLDDLKDQIFETMATIPASRLKQRVLDYLLKNFKFNTHSLRYARVNYLLNQGKDVTTVAKYIGHNNVNTILHYCQKKNVDKIDDFDD